MLVAYALMVMINRCSRAGKSMLHRAWQDDGRQGFYVIQLVDDITILGRGDIQETITIKGCPLLFQIVGLSCHQIS